MVFDHLYIAAQIEPFERDTFHTKASIPVGVEIVDLGASNGLTGLLAMGGTRLLARALRGVDYVHMLSGHVAVKAYLLNRISARRPFCVYERGHWLDDEQIRARFQGLRHLAVPMYRVVMGRLRRAMLTDAHMVFVHGDELLRECMEIRQGKGVEQVVPLLPLGQHHFFKREDTCASGRAKLLYVGGVGGKKGVEYLFEAVGQLRACERDVELRMITKAPLLSNQEALLDALGLRDHVRIEVGLPWLRVIEAYRVADLLVVPSLSEGFPRVIYEGLSQSVPIVATGVGGIPGLMKDGENALLVEPYSAGALRGAIEQLLDDSGLRRRLIRNGLVTAEALFGPDRPFQCHAQQVRFHAGREAGDSGRLAFYNRPDYHEGRQRNFDGQGVELYSHLLPNGIVVQMGCGSANHPNVPGRLVGVDLSMTALKRGSGSRVCADWMFLPFRDASLDAIFSNATLEHVPDPGLAVKETARTVKPGGIVVHNDAWFCRAWTASGITVKPWSECSLREKLLKFTIPVRNSRAFRAPSVLLRRLWRELSLAWRRGACRLDYRRLKSNLEAPITSDADAFASIDPHAIVSYYRSRGFLPLRPSGGFLRRVLHTGWVALRREPRKVLFLKDTVPNLVREPLLAAVERRMRERGLVARVLYLRQYIDNKAWRAEASPPSYDHCVAAGLLDVAREFWRVWPEVVVASWGYPAGWLALFYCTLFGRKLMAWSGTHAASVARSWRIAEAAKRFFVSRVNAFVTYGSQPTEYLQRLGAPPERIVQACNVGDVDYYASAVAAFRVTPEFTRERALHARIVLLFAGQLVERKGVLPLVDAFLESEVKDCALWLAGSGPLNGTIRQRVAARGATDRVRLLGFLERDEMARMYALADVFVLPSLVEPFSIVMSEALSAGLYVIASKYDGAACDLVREGVNGQIVDPANTGELRRALQWVMQHANDLPSREAIRQSVARFTVEAYAERIMQAVGLTLGESA